MTNIDTVLVDNTIFKIKLWISRIEYELYVFNGTSENKVKDVDAKKVIYVNEYLSYTDTINTVKYKLMKYLNIKDWNLLLTSTVNVDIEKLKTFVQGVFKSKVSIDSTYFNSVCAQYFNNYKGINMSSNILFDEALDKLKNTTEMQAILTFKYHNLSDLNEIISPDPFANVDEINENSVLTHLDNNLLFKFNLAHPTINCYIPMDTIDTKYFPLKQSLNLKKYNEYIDNKNKIFQRFDNIDDIVDIHSSYIDLLYFRVIPYSHDIQLNMKNIFKISSVGEDVPIIIYRSKYTNEYKVNKFSLTRLEKKQIDLFKEQEQKYENVSLNRTNETIIFYYKIFESVFVYILLSSNGSYKIKYKFNKSHDINIKYIISNFSKINAILESFEEPRMFIIKNDMDIFDNSAIEVIEFNTYSRLTFKKKINENVLKKSNVLFDFLKEEKNLLFLKFIEVNNYYNTDSISSFIYKNIELNRVDMVNKLEQYFKIPTDIASSLYDEKRGKLRINISKKGQNVFAIKTYDTAVNVKINILSDYSIKVITSNTQNVFYQNLILFYISQLLCTTNKIPLIPKNVDLHAVNDVNDVNDVNVDFNDIVDFNEIDDIDLDDLNDLNIDVSSPIANIEDEVDVIHIEDVEPDQEVDYSDSGKKTDYTTFVLERLYKADPELFLWKNTDTNLKNYASKCGAVNYRQPIVINEKEKKNIDKHHPGSYTDFVKTGSTEALKQENFYICPNIWCRISKVSMTKEEYIKNGNKCPTNEEGLFFPKKGTPDSNNYFINKDGIEAHYPALLNKNKHPKNLELPCCGKKPLKNIKTDIKNTSHYVSNISSELLLDAKQYGNLPYILNIYLNKKSNCIGTIDAKTYCHVRTGVYQHTNSLISIIETILDIPSFTDVISKKFDIEQYIFLNNGNTLKGFADPSHQYDIFNKEKYGTFKKYFVNNIEYIKRFDLNEEYEYVKTHDVINQTNDMLILSIMREYLIYKSFITFKTYILDNDIQKHLDDIQHLLTYECVNPKNINFVFLSVEKENVYFMNPKYYDHNEYLSSSNPVAFILKIDSKYEYISYISQKKKVKEILSFEYGLAENLLNSFSEKVETVHHDVDKLVLSSSFMCVGSITNNIFTPFNKNVELIYDGHGIKNKFTYVSKLSKNKVTKYNELEMSKERYDELTNSHIIRMNLELLSLVNNKDSENDRSLFDKTLFDIATKFIKNKTLSNSLYVLNHEMTNFTTVEKYVLLKKIVNKCNMKIPNDINEKHIFESLLRIPLQHILDHYKLKLINDDPSVIYLTYSDILNNKLLEFKNTFENKFKVIDKTIGDFTEEISYIKLKKSNEKVDAIFSMNIQKIELTPARLKKIIGDKFAIINEVLPFSKLISILNNYNVNVTAESAKKAIEDYVLKTFVSDKSALINKLNKNINILRTELSSMKKSIDNIFKVIFDSNYKYSVFEIEILSKLANLNVIVLGRNTNIVPNGILYHNNKSSEFLLLNYTINDNQYDFKLIVNDTDKYVYKQTSFNDNLNNLLEIM